MTQVITFEDYTPIARYDSTPWTEARIEEATAVDGTWAEIETITLDPVDSDPSSPLQRNLTTTMASDTIGLWYRIVFVDGSANESAATTAVQNSAQPTPYVDADELARILKINAPTAAQTDAMNRVLLMAAQEIDDEIDRASTDDPLTSGQTAIAAEVNLERAVELWRATPWGIVGIDSEIGATHISRNTWERYALMLAPIKTQWGLA